MVDVLGLQSPTDVATEIVLPYFPGKSSYFPGKNSYSFTPPDPSLGFPSL